MRTPLSPLNAVSFTFVLVILFFLSADTSFAQPIEVTNLNDAGAGSLRQAIIDANNNMGPDEIVFPGGLTGTITLMTGEMVITDDLTITGPGADQLTIDADNASRIFNIDDSDPGPTIDVSINGLSLINGNVAGDNGGAIFNTEVLTITSCIFSGNSTDLSGGVIYNDTGTIENITDSTFSGNSAQFGGAILNDGTLQNIMNSTFSRNMTDANGGAIFNANTRVIGGIVNSTFSGNMSDFSGGAIVNSAGTIQNITNSIFSGNSAAEGGGAISNEGTIENITNSSFSMNGIATGGAILNFGGATIGSIANSTFSGNSAEEGGGAIYNSFFGTIENITNSTFNGNTAAGGGAIRNDAGTINVSFTTIAENIAGNAGGGGIFELALSVHLRNSIVAFNEPENCAGDNPPEDEEGNYSDDDSCGFSGDSSFIELGPLANNGGQTMTMALLAGAPLDGATADCDALDGMSMPTGIPIGIDQRFFPRPFGPACDSGAYEAGPAGVNITKVTIPTGQVTEYSFTSTGFEGIPDCGITPAFTLSDMETASCVVDEGDYTITEDIPVDQALNIFCTALPPVSAINSLTGMLSFTISGPDTPVNCLFINAFADTLVNAEEEPPGENCEFGGVKIESGRDTNQNGVLDPNEVEETFYVCNGADGLPGPPGPPGPDINIEDEPPGPNCEFGGIKIEVGTDTNQNGQLDPEEVEETFYVCDGAPGGEGPPGPAGSNGSNCALAGSGGTAALGGFLLYALLPVFIWIRKRYRRV